MTRTAIGLTANVNLRERSLMEENKTRVIRTKKSKHRSEIASVVMATAVLACLLMSTYPLMVSATDAYLLDGGWQWHYDDTSDATKAILTKVVRVDGSTEVNIPEHLSGTIDVLSIAANCFKDAEGHKITKILSMPSTITSIGASAFDGCSLMTSCIIGAGVTAIGAGAFYGCTVLTSIVIPASVTAIGNTPFWSCASLTTITVDASNAIYANNAGDGVLYNKAITTLMVCPAGDEARTSFTVPNSVVSIADYAFRYCIFLVSVTMGEGVSSIGYAAFQSCIALTSVIIPNSVTFMGDSAFVSCTSLASAAIGSGVTAIPASAFRYDAGLTSVIMGTGVISIGNYAFQECSALTSLNVPNSVTSIGSYAFNGCTAMVSLPVGSGVVSIGSYAFIYCESLISAIIPNSVVTLGNMAFGYCTGLITITVGTGVTTIGSSEFSGCSLLTSIKFFGLVAPVTVGTNWIAGTPAEIRGHAYVASNFPAPGNAWHGLMMGTVLGSSPNFTSMAPTTAWEDHEYSYLSVCDQPIATWGLTTNASWLSQDPATGEITGIPNNTDSMKSYFVDISATNTTGTAWQNYSVFVANNQPVITSTPNPFVFRHHIFLYDPICTDEGSQGGVYLGLVTNYTGTYAFWTSNGTVMFNASEDGEFWFNVSFTDQSGSANQTTYQNWTLWIETDPLDISEFSMPSIPAFLAIAFGFGLIALSLVDKRREIWGVFTGFVWIALSVVVFLDYGLIWFIIALGIGFMLMLEGSIAYAAGRSEAR